MAARIAIYDRAVKNYFSIRKTSLKIKRVCFGIAAGFMYPGIIVTK
jgi:hypothetical protein